MRNAASSEGRSEDAAKESSKALHDSRKATRLKDEGPITKVFTLQVSICSAEGKAGGHSIKVTIYGKRHHSEWPELTFPAVTQYLLHV